MMLVQKWWRPVVWAAVALILIALPQLFPGGYLVNIMIQTVMWIVFALSFDLSAGHVGTVSLGHPVFFGVSAYLTGIVSQHFGLDVVSSMIFSAVSMALLALVSGLAFFRISGVSFAIGTLGALVIAQLLANNAYDLTGGPLCTKGIMRPIFSLPFTGVNIRIVETVQYYYLLLPVLAVTLLVYWALTTSRIGRAFVAVREDELRATAVGIHPLRYKLLAFAVGGALVGMLGTFQALYTTVVCPSELAQTYNLNLLIIIFVGGASRLFGVFLGAVIFSVLPRLLELGGAMAIPPTYQQVVYGLILLIVIEFLPGGLAGGLDSLIQYLADLRRRRIASGARHEA